MISNYSTSSLRVSRLTSTIPVGMMEIPGYNWIAWADPITFLSKKIIMYLDKMVPGDFDWKTYLILNPDVAKKNCTESFSKQHWLNHGKQEGRLYESKDIPKFNWKFYTSYYYDLNNLTTEDQALKHYIFYGRNENRLCDNRALLSSNYTNLPIVLIITHTMGGGCEYFYKTMLSQITTFRFVTLRCQPKEAIKLIIPWLETQYFKGLNNQLVNTLKNLHVNRIYVSQVVGYSFPLILRFSQNLGIPYTVTLHDGYYLYSDLQTYSKRHRPDVQNTINSFLKGALIISAPSLALKDFYLDHIASLDIKVIPHEVLVFEGPLSVMKRSKPLLVGIIGTINSVPKGRDILISCSQDAYTRQLPLNFIVFGTITGNHKHIEVTGRYSSHIELFERFKKYQPHLLWIPGICHESYCYVLSLILMSGLPCTFPDLKIYRERTHGFIGCDLYSPILTPSQINDYILAYYEQLTNPFPVTHVKMTHNLNPQYLEILE
jgi:hypothetical protein